MLVREVINFSSFWRSTTFSSTVEPTIYLLAFGFGFGSLVSPVGGYDYVEFVGTGTVATAVLFSSAFPAMFGTFVKYKFQRTYDAILAAPVDIEELVTAEALWIGVARRRLRLRAAARGDRLRARPGWGMLLVPVDRLRWPASGCGLLRHPRSRRSSNSIDNFNYVISAVLTPLFLVAGTFFPLDELPEWAQVARAASTRSTTASSSCATRRSASRAGSTSCTSRCSSPSRSLMWRLAIWRLEKRLIELATV